MQEKSPPKIGTKLASEVNRTLQQFDISIEDVVESMRKNFE